MTVLLVDEEVKDWKVDDEFDIVNATEDLERID